MSDQQSPAPWSRKGYRILDATGELVGVTLSAISADAALMARAYLLPEMVDAACTLDLGHLDHGSHCDDCAAAIATLVKAVDQYRGLSC